MAISIATNEPLNVRLLENFLNITPAKYANGDIIPNNGEQYDISTLTNIDNETVQPTLR